MEEEIKSYLHKFGCCVSCTNVLVFGETTAFISTCEVDKVESMIYDEQSKKIRPSVCMLCLGLFTSQFTEAAVKKIAEKLEESKYDAKQFGLNLSVPLAVNIRYCCILLLLKDKYPHHSFKEAKIDHLFQLKNVWKLYTGELVSKMIDMEFITGQTVDFTINISPSYSDDEIECKVLDKLSEEKFSVRKKQVKKFNEGVYTRQAVSDTFKTITSEYFVKNCPQFPPEPLHPIEVDEVLCHHTAVFLAGRYNKYSRELPQTPWLVDGSRRVKSSVQELIADVINKSIKADSIKFSASGREDVDVRCLGSGRPFVIELINPRRVHITPYDLVDLQNEVNTSTDLVAIRDLQTVLRTDTSHLKSGEEEKTKAYCALCYVPEGYLIEDLDKINDFDEIELYQSTPLRVLHRRSSAVRVRLIHSVSAQSINDHYFKLFITTQAGTYIKEFVHGDFGRTVPNLRSVLGHRVDIVALDVEDVKLDWPPIIK